MNKDRPQATPENVTQDVSLESLQALLRIFYSKYIVYPTDDRVEQEVSKFPLSEYDSALPSERVSLYHEIQTEISTLEGLQTLRAELKIGVNNLQKKSGARKRTQ